MTNEIVGFPLIAQNIFAGKWSLIMFGMIFVVTCKLCYTQIPTTNVHQGKYKYIGDHEISIQRIIMNWE